MFAPGPAIQWVDIKSAGQRPLPARRFRPRPGPWHGQFLCPIYPWMGPEPCPYG